MMISNNKILNILAKVSIFLFVDRLDRQALLMSGALMGHFEEKVCNCTAENIVVTINDQTVSYIIRVLIYIYFRCCICRQLGIYIVT